MSSSIKIKESGERCADAHGEDHSAEVVGQRVACLDWLRVQVNVGELMAVHGLLLWKKCDRRFLLAHKVGVNLGVVVGELALSAHERIA